MPEPQIEGAVRVPPGALAPLEPDAFADLVADRLAGKTEVPVDLAVRELLVEQRGVLEEERPRELGGPRGSGIGASRRHRHLAVEADVDDDSGSAEGLGREHPQLERRVFEVAELAHEPFGVQRVSSSARNTTWPTWR